MINNELEYEKMALVENELWWYRVLHEKILDFLSANEIKKDELILDIGCGTGGLMQKMSKLGYTAKGIDISESAINFCKKKSLNVIQGNILDVRESWFALKPRVVVANDSLYFFSDEEVSTILTNIRSILDKEGVIIINYPVIEAFRGVHDLSVGIKKRKSKKALESLIVSSGYNIVYSDYWPFFLSPLIFLVRVFQRVKLKVKKNVEITSDVSLPPKVFNKLFYYLTKIEGVVKGKPWGSSLFIIAKKKDD